MDDRMIERFTSQFGGVFNMCPTLLATNLVMESEPVTPRSLVTAQRSIYRSS